MQKNRLEAFTDGVIAIIITIMVLELKVPHGSELSDLFELLPVFWAYILSFLYVAIYWNNLHHLFRVVEKINGGVMWAQIHLLFWLSLIPFASGWMWENHFTFLPVILYGTILLCSALSYFILVQVLIKIHETKSLLNQAIWRDKKGKISLFLYIGGIMSTVILSPWVWFLIYGIVAILWLVPDKRIEKIIEE